MDKNGFLIDLSESERVQFGSVDFADQHDDQKVFSATWELESQVNNGGFSRYASNSDGDIVGHAAAALRKIGAARCAGIVERALRVISSDALPLDADARQELIESLDDAAQAKLERLDAEFLAYPDDLTELLFEFVRARPAVFGPVSK
jgi:hypothetical protein